MRTIVVAAVLLALATAPALAAIGGYGVVQTIGTGADTVKVLYTGGTPYEIGYWHGYLLKDDVKYVIDNTLPIAEDEAGGAAALLLVWSFLQPFVPTDVMEELQGLADGAGIPISQVYEMHAIPDASEFDCSNFCAFGSATTNGHTLQSRILDWSVDIMIQDRPLIIVAEPIGGFRYTNLTFAGMLGSIAGFNSRGIGIGEMGDEFDAAFQTLSGIPLEFFMKEVIAHSSTFEEAFTFMQNAHRTSSLWYMLGDANTPTARLFATSPVRFDNWGPGENMTHPDGRTAPGLPDLCYGGHYNEMLHDDLQAAWGHLDIDTMIAITRKNMMPKSNLMDGVWDLNTGEVWVAYAEGETSTAGNRPFVYLDTNAFKSPPYVTGTSPADGAVELPAGGRVTASFSMALDPTTVNGDTVQLRTTGGTPVAGTVSYDASSQSVVFVAAEGLPQDGYRMTLVGGPAGLKGTNGQRMVANYVWLFHTPLDTELPQVSFVTPHAGQAVRGQVTIQATAADSGGLDRVELFVDRVNVLSKSTPPFSAVWNTVPLAVAEGSHTLLARAYDRAGNRADATCSVIVDNTSYDDVAKTSASWQYVEAITREKITSGCSQTPPLFCPASPVTRGQMAVFLCRAAGFAPCDNLTPTFIDVPRADPYYCYVEALYRQRVTTGCSQDPPLFCPDQPITRGQMAVFLCRAAGLQPYNKPTPTFSDVPPTDQRYTYVEAISRAGITSGCGDGRFCPSANTARAQMAVFLCRAFGIPTQ